MVLFSRGFGWRACRVAIFGMFILGLARWDVPAHAAALPYLLQAPKQSTAPVLDGSLGAREYGGLVWNVSFADDVNPGRMHKTLNTDYDGTDADMSFSMRAVHTSEAIFLGFRVWDDYLELTPESNDAAWHNDNVEVYFDGDRVFNDMGPNGFGGGNKAGFELITDVKGQKWATGVSANDFDSAVGILGDGYIVEFRIPLTLINTHDGFIFDPPVPAKTGDILRFTGAITDNDRVYHDQEGFGQFWREGNENSPWEDGEASWHIDFALVPEPSGLALTILGLAVPWLSRHRIG